MIISFLRDVAVPIAVFVVLPVFLWYQRDRRKSRAEAAVAERTVGVDVSTKEVGAFGASVAFVEEAFRVERESKDRQIKALEREVHDVETRCQQKVAEVTREMGDRLAEKDALIAELRKQLEEALTRIARLEGSSA